MSMSSAGLSNIQPGDILADSTIDPPLSLEDMMAVAAKLSSLQSTESDSDSESTSRSNPPVSVPSSLKLNHEFSNYSLWLTPSSLSLPSRTTAFITSTIKTYTPSAQLPFKQHLTLLYNFDLAPLRAHQSSNPVDLNEEKALSIELLTAIKSKYSQSLKKECATLTPTPGLDHPSLSISHFHYPKTADGGKGFGAYITYLLLQQSDGLQSLYDIVVDGDVVKVKDERGGGGGTGWIPHVALGYLSDSVDSENGVDNNNVGAVEFFNVETSTRLSQELFSVMEEEGGSEIWREGVRLEIWSTKGRIGEWREVAGIELCGE